MDEDTALAWELLQRRLAEHLTTMTDTTDHLVLGVLGDSAEGDQGGPYVAASSLDFGDRLALRAELSGNSALTASHRLSAAEHRSLARAGWTIGGTRVRGNYGLVLPIDDAARVARLMVQALRDVFGVAHPTLLTAHSHGPASERVGLLGVPREQDVADDVVRSPRSHHGRSEDALSELRQSVATTLGRHTGCEVVPNADGDFVISLLDQITYVAVHADHPTIEIMAPVAYAPPSEERTGVELGRLNRDHAWSKWLLRDGEIWHTAMVPARPFVGDHLIWVLNGFFADMAETRDALIARLGATSR